MGGVALRGTEPCPSKAGDRAGEIRPLQRSGPLRHRRSRRLTRYDFMAAVLDSGGVAGISVKGSCRG